MIDFLHENEYLKLMEKKKKDVDSKSDKQYPYVYFIKASEQPCYLPGRSADIVIKNTANQNTHVVGHFGILHPEVLKKFEIPHLISAMHMDVLPLSDPSLFL